MENAMIAIAILAIYLLPLGIAIQRKHRSVGAIAFVNIALGWTAVCWLWAMIWSLTGNVHEPDKAGPTVPAFGPSGERLK